MIVQMINMNNTENTKFTSIIQVLNLTSVWKNLSSKRTWTRFCKM